MNKTNSGKEKNIKKRKNIRIVGNYIAFGHSAQDAFENLIDEIYSRRNGHGHMAHYMFSDKNGNYHAAKYDDFSDKSEFMNYGGRFKVYFIIEGKDIYHIAASYLIKGMVKKGSKQWVATASVSRIKVRVEPVVPWSTV